MHEMPQCCLIVASVRLASKLTSEDAAAITLANSGVRVASDDLDAVAEGENHSEANDEHDRVGASVITEGLHCGLVSEAVDTSGLSAHGSLGHSGCPNSNAEENRTRRRKRRGGEGKKKKIK